LGTDIVKFDTLKIGLKNLKNVKENSLFHLKESHKELYEPYYEQPFIVKNDKLNFDNSYFSQLLNDSLSLDEHEKRRIMDQLHNLSQFQIDQLIKMFEEEDDKFLELEKEFPEDVAYLKKITREANAFAKYCIANNKSLGQWNVWDRLSKTKQQKLDEETGVLMVKLGELQNRICSHDGIVKINEGIEILTNIPSLARNSQNALDWAKLYILKFTKFDNLVDYTEKNLFKLRESIKNEVSITYIIKIQESLKYFLEDNLNNFQLSMSVSADRLLSNQVMDACRWLENKNRHNLCAEDIENIQNIFDTAIAKSTSDNNSSSSLLSPESKFDAMQDILISENYLGLNKDEFDHKKDEILNGLNKAGIRAFAANLDFIFIKWEKEILEINYEKALDFAHQYYKTATEISGELEDFNLLFPNSLKLISLCLTKNNLKELELELDSIKKTIEKYSANKSLGWMLLSEAYINIDKKSYVSATKSLIQARKSFNLYNIGVPKSATILYKNAIKIIDKNVSKGFESIGDQLSEAEKKPADLTPWDISRYEKLPKKVKNIIDGKTMRLVKGGLQSDANGNEIWIYPFYIDEFPVTTDELKQYKQDVLIKDPQNSFLLTTQTIAEEYAKWSQKELPNKTEWYIATTQLSYKKKPEIWKI
jgi:hypothetical protein